MNRPRQGYFNGSEFAKTEDYCRWTESEAMDDTRGHPSRDGGTSALYQRRLKYSIRTKEAEGGDRNVSYISLHCVSAAVAKCLLKF